jgi:hypothetical protein
MSDKQRYLLRWGCILAGLMGLLITGSGCQMLRLPWASNAGLPAQWEPDVPE